MIRTLIGALGGLVVALLILGVLATFGVWDSIGRVASILGGLVLGMVFGQLGIFIAVWRE
ncbi:hypothetical protein LCGC14_2216130 [marine sediment metagenome]|uniref:Uncharacterized protein n=1 Tax=marine sediment metagenome TaxID=412755 RepID=A0A0F9FQ28_9ZZZZ